MDASVVRLRSLPRQVVDMGRDGIWEVLLKPVGKGLHYVGSGQPKSTGRRQGFASSWWPGGAAQGLPG